MKKRKCVSVNLADFSFIFGDINLGLRDLKCYCFEKPIKYASKYVLKIHTLERFFIVKNVLFFLFLILTVALSV